MLISQRNITVPCPVCNCCWLKWNSGWWENVCNIYSEVRFKKTFRVSQVAYNFILNNIEPSLIQQIVMEEVILPALRLAICQYRLDRGEYLNTIVEIPFYPLAWFGKSASWSLPSLSRRLNFVVISSWKHDLQYATILPAFHTLHSCCFQTENTAYRSSSRTSVMYISCSQSKRDTYFPLFLPFCRKTSCVCMTKCAKCG